MEFEFATATRILFGRGKISQIGAVSRTFGTSALIITGRSQNRAQAVLASLAEEGIKTHLFSVKGEPAVDEIRQGAGLARSSKCDLVIGFGGGSPIDAAKAIAALITNSGDLFDYLEVVGKALPLQNRAAPCITIPTTAGTGAEVTRNSVLAAPEHRFKVSLRSPYLLPVLALIDPELSADLPPALTAATGLDALTQLIEPFVSHRATPLTDGFCREGIKRAARSLGVAFRDGRNFDAREDMALAALLSGLSLANAALGAVHGFAAPLGGMYSAAHGAFCAALLPAAMEVNIRALRQRQSGSEALQRYEEVARLLTGNPSSRAEDGEAWVRNLCTELGIVPLRQLGVQKGDFAMLTEKASKASSMKGNPILLTNAEMEEILQASF